MAEKKQKKTQAEQAASAKKNKPAKKTAVKDNGKDRAPEVKANLPKERKFPPRFISSATFLCRFVCFLIAFAYPQGLAFEWINGLLHGLFGRIGFLVSIPVLLYLFVIHAFSGKKPVTMRTICLALFVLCTGAIAHLALKPDHLPDAFFTLISELYLGGIDGTTGGVFCGLIAGLFYLFFRNVSYLVLGICAVLTLLAGMQITVSSIVRAIQNRPRPNWEEEEPKEERQEPAAVVVNHIANKHIARLENQRNKAEAERLERERNRPMTKEERTADMIRQIDDVDAPVTAASEPVTGIAQEEDVIPMNIPDREPIPQTMPPLEMDADPAPAPIPAPEKVKIKKVTAKETKKTTKTDAAAEKENTEDEKPDYSFPPIDLLKGNGGGAVDGTEEMKENTRRLTETLASFRIEARIINVTRGPSVTRYEVELEKGVRLNKLTNAADDIALSLGATGVRIAAIPGKISVVGIEVPNIAVTTVSLREVIDSPEFKGAKSKSAFSVGKDIAGNCIVGNIAKLPHMLIAGTTGSGKSVCMNSIIISLLYKAKPEDVNLIMIDPKMVELGIYNGIPHLRIPVITDPKKAAGSLQWTVVEMMRRYRIMSDAGVRDIESYNSIVESQAEEGKKLPQIVVIIDELADLMMVVAKEVEDSVCRIAQMGRAAGMHLVIATQRPSADVITGLMKANIPSRIAFAVASSLESRIILDTVGAEKLVGRGDMLYAPLGAGKPRRVQGCMITAEEIEEVVNFVKSNSGEANYNDEVIRKIEESVAEKDKGGKAAPAQESSADGEADELLDAAVEVILETGQASVSMLQRRLKLGYSRAARLVDQMEERGIVGPFEGSKPRQLLITRAQWEERKMGGNPAFDEIPEEDFSQIPEDEEE